MALVPLVAAAVCPHPPLLVPEVAGAASTELAELRAACDRVVARLLAAEPDRIVLLGCGSVTMSFGAAEHGSFHRYGIHRRVPLSPTDAADRTDEAAAGPARLPLSLTIGAWLLGRAGTALPRSAVAVAADEPAARCAALGAGLLNRDLSDAGLINADLLGSVPGNASDGATSCRLGLLVLGDGSACRVEWSPGSDDPRAEPYDQAVARALAGADTRALGALDAELSAGLKATGRAPWQVLAGAVRAAGGSWSGELAYAAAPYGVTYLVASWAPTGAAR
ncbi:class III extradiol dioxygenase subunit B-like domain-containing protein [Salinispora cortesiana]|uniref:class III extradiol dioxygenase subunit B-like domain-containing protein n=1 Tax=Salinispora cortesiana TaxID=1305843 RepID=UPI00042A72BF|nr:class III extradiol dioxygenase subunit B-like domain-containing protein [Salinispora cortesiana]